MRGLFYLRRELNRLQEREFFNNPEINMGFEHTDVRKEDGS